MAFPENGKKVVRRDSTTFNERPSDKIGPGFFSARFFSHFSLTPKTSSTPPRNSIGIPRHRLGGASELAPPPPHSPV